MTAPAVVVTVYNDMRGVRALPILDALARDAAPGDLGVCIHDPPSGDDRALADAVREAARPAPAPVVQPGQETGRETARRGHLRVLTTE